MSLAAEKRSLTLSGRAGSITLDMKALDPSGLMAFRMLRLPAAGAAGAAGAQAAGTPGAAGAQAAGAPAAAGAGAEAHAGAGTAAGAGAAAGAASSSNRDSAGSKDGKQAPPKQARPPARSMLALATPNKDRFDAFVAELDASVRGVMVGYLVGVTVKGVGYR